MPLMPDIIQNLRSSSAARRGLELVARGRSNAEIGAALYVSEATVKTHVTPSSRSSGFATACSS